MNVLGGYRHDEMAKQQAYAQEQSAQYVQAELKPTVFSAATQVLAAQGKRLEEINSQVEGFLARIYGPQPVNKADGAATPQPTGAFSQLERALELNERLIRELLEQVQRLSEIG